MLLNEAERACARDVVLEETYGELIPPSPALKGFAETHGVRTKRDSCGELIVLSKRLAMTYPNGWPPEHAAPKRWEYHCHIGEHSRALFYVCLLFMTKKRYGNAKRKLLAAGFTLSQDGETEGLLTFDPADVKQSRLALRLVGAKRRRVLTPERRQAQIDNLARARAARKSRQVVKNTM